MNDKLSVMFLNLDMKRRRTGIENAALLRARMFERELGIIPSILTVSYDPHFAETRTDLLRSGFITDNLLFRNLYDWFQEMDAAKPLAETSSESSAVVETVLNDEWKVASVAGTPDSRIYDADGTCLMYRKCSRDTGVLEYVNYFCEVSGNRRKWRRDTYTTTGLLSRIQYIDPASGESLFEHYLRPDGSVAIIQLYQLENGQRELRKISLMNRCGACIAEYSGIEGLVERWLREITGDPERQFVMVSDKNRVYYRPARRVRNTCENGNIVLIPIIHAVHTKNGFNIRTSGTNVNYADILNDLRAQDAVVVGTEQQKHDIIERYENGSLHVIPQAFHEGTAGEPPAFETRDRMKVIYVGRYSEEKNHPAAIRAFTRVVEAVPAATLHLYGSGSSKAAIEELVRSLGMEQSIFVNGYTTDVAAVYESAGLSLLTSKGEGYALVIMESLCHGCPVVAFDVRYGPADMITDGETGLLVPFNDEAALASALIGLLQDRDRHAQMCNNARHSATGFGAGIVADRWKTLLKTTLPLGAGVADSSN